MFQKYVSTGREKTCHWQKCLKTDKKWFPLAVKSVFTNWNAFKNTFPLDGKIKLAVAGVSQNGRKKWFLLARVSTSTSRNKVIFQKLELPLSANRKKIKIKEYCFNYTESWFPIAGMENSFKNKLLFDEKTASIDRNIQKIKENGCQYQ